FSAARLDSFVYTVESLRQAWSLVKPGGLLSVSFVVRRKFITDKLYEMMVEATGQKPLVMEDSYLYSATFVVPKDGDPAKDQASWLHMTQMLGGHTLAAPTEPEATNPSATDDWPFLMLQNRQLSIYYAVALVLLLLMSAVLVSRTFVLASPAGIDWQLFWLGGGFLLIETKSMTQLGLLFGSTWVVNAIAIVGVLFMNLVAVYFIAWKPNVTLRALYTGLFTTIVVNFIVPPDAFLALPLAARLTASTLLLFCPLFFAGLIFIRSFRVAADSPSAFGSNLLGAISGGCLEYLSIATGFRVVWLLALGLYVLSLVAVLRHTREASLNPGSASA
ncbi:MAG TPA: hypothetical protein VGO93_19350, partial [Candidatus Xenobia bacterium]